jgi:hypothetical protein
MEAINLISIGWINIWGMEGEGILNKKMKYQNLLSKDITHQSE